MKINKTKFNLTSAKIAYLFSCLSDSKLYEFFGSWLDWQPLRCEISFSFRNRGTWYIINENSQNQLPSISYNMIFSLVDEYCRIWWRRNVYGGQSRALTLDTKVGIQEKASKLEPSKKAWSMTMLKIASTLPFSTLIFSPTLTSSDMLSLISFTTRILPLFKPVGSLVSTDLPVASCNSTI